MLFDLPSRRQIVVVWFMVFAGFSMGTVSVEAQSSPEEAQATRASDATLRDCVAPSADRIWAVGDRGLILASENGGRTWNQQESYTETNLSGVAFDSDRVGWAVGGSIHPYSHRSVGVVLATRDGGKIWTSIDATDLPRLTGVQSFGGGYLLAWGDWSPALQTGLIESSDGGITWNPRPMPTSHLETCAWRDAHHGIVVDRLSRVFYCSASEPPKLLEFASDPTKPILSAAINEAGWWLAGANGQVFWSIDGKKWSQRSLPGNTSDHQLMKIHDLVLIGEHVWLVGVPGNVVWHSEDRGLSWDVQSISTTLPMHCICSSTSESLIIAGTLSNIHGSRNRGRGWWPIHSWGSRIALVNIAATVDRIAWDSLAYMANETRHQAAAFVLHSQRTHERMDAFCDRDHRVEGLANPLSLSFVEICSRFPVGDLTHGRRKSDVVGYKKAGVSAQSSPLDERRLLKDELGPSMIARQLALWIRTTRPDALICDELIEEDTLLVASSEAVRTAQRLASEAGFRCFSADARIVEQAWNCKRILARSQDSRNPLQSSINRRSEINYAPTTAIKSTGKLLSDLLAPVSPIVDAYPENGRFKLATIDGKLYSDYVTIFGTMSKASKDHLLIEVSNAKETLRPILKSRPANFQTMLATTQHSSLISRLLEMQGPDVQHDVRWQASLKSFLRSTPAELHADSLWQLAQGYRSQGYWNRWRFCLDTLMAESPRSGVAELACLQILQFLGSDEVNLFRTSLSNTNSEVAIEPQSHLQTSFISSPFELSVQPAKHASPIVEPSGNHTDEFQKFRASLPVRFSWLQWDPRIAVIDAAFQRKHARSESPQARFQNPLNRIASFHGLLGWPAIGTQELQLEARKATREQEANVPNIFSEKPHLVSMTHARPKLDGRMDDSFWHTTKSIPMESVWSDDRLSECDLRMAHDGAFLYFVATCSRSKLNHNVKRESIPEILTIRFDTDRDYLTWFELQIKEDGSVIELCNDMSGWKPEWYFKIESKEDRWSCEAAIPFSQLQAKTIETNSIWAMAIERMIPNRGVQMNRNLCSDQLLFSSPRLIRFDNGAPIK